MTTESYYSQDYEFTKTREALKPLPLPHLTGMKLARDISIGDFVFNTIDEFGVIWVITDMEGWWAHPEPEVPDVPRGFGDGSYDVKGRYKARTITFNGTILTPDPSLLEAARDRLALATDLVYKGAWLKTGSNPTRAAWVRMVGAANITTVNARGRTDFSFQLRAVDPIKYSWNDEQPDGYDIVEFGVKNLNLEGSGSVTITNNGNYPVPVLFEISGPLTGPATIFNATREELILVTEGLLGLKQAIIETKQMSFDSTNISDIATLTTRAAHNFVVGDLVTVAGVGDPFDGDYTISSTPTSTTFTYERLPAVSEIYQVVYKSLASGVATLETSTDHGLEIGDSITVVEVDSVFNGTYTVTDTPDDRKVQFLRGRVPTATVSGARLVSNIATLTTNAPHGFIRGENVTVSGVDPVNYNGSFVITDVSSDGRQFSYAKSRTGARGVSAISMTALVATATTSAAHGFVVGERVQISGTSASLDGQYVISAVPTDTTFRYERPRSSRVAVTVKSANGTTATLTTAAEHGLSVNDRVVVTGVDATFNGTYTITQVPSSTAFSYAKTATVAPTAVAEGYATPSRVTVLSKTLIGNVATLGTSASHGFLVGETVTVTGVDATFNGSYIITAATEKSLSYTKTAANISTTQTLFAITTRDITNNVASLTASSAHGYTVGTVIYVNKVNGINDGAYTLTAVDGTKMSFAYTAANLASGNAGDGAYVSVGFVEANTNIAQFNTPNGEATVAGSLPFVSKTGTATVSGTIPRTQSVGVIVKKSEVRFTPGVTSGSNVGSATVDADILEIDTLNREVAYNGEIIGARGRIDVLADFIRLDPGENVIQFEDNGNSESEATMRVFYRSGWLT